MLRVGLCVGVRDRRLESRTPACRSPSWRCSPSPPPTGQRPTSRIAPPSPAAFHASASRGALESCSALNEIRVPLGVHRLETESKAAAASTTTCSPSSAYRAAASVVCRTLRGRCSPTRPQPRPLCRRHHEAAPRGRAGRRSRAPSVRHTRTTPLARLQARVAARQRARAHLGAHSRARRGVARCTATSSTT